MRSLQKVEESTGYSRKWRSQSYMQMVQLGGGRRGRGGDGDEEDVALFAQENCHSRRSLSYHRLPQQLLRLSVLKLDGSCFEIQVERKASISELKLAIENIFSKSSKEGEGEREISWSHVWGHFCLSYQDKKLINDKESLGRLGIKDGDQLHFVRHLSIIYSPIKKKHSRTARSTSNHLHVMSRQESNIDEENEEDDCGQEDNKPQHYSENEAMVGHVNFKLTHFLKGCLLHSGMWSRNRRSEGRSHPSKIAGQCVKAGRKMMLL